MKGEDIVQIIRSPAFTLITATLCVVFFLKQVPPIIVGMKTIKKAD